MAGFLQAPPTTPLYERMVKEGRYLDDHGAPAISTRPIFERSSRSPFCCRVARKLLVSLYSASAFYNRAYRSLLQWETRKPQKAAGHSVLAHAGHLFRSIFHQGILSSYRRAYWKFLLQILTRWSRIHRN